MGLSWIVWDSGFHRLFTCQGLVLTVVENACYLLDDPNAAFEQLLSLGAEKFSAPFYHLPWALILRDLVVGNPGIDSKFWCREELHSPT